LTDAARVLVSHADLVFAQLERATNELRAMSGAVTPTVRIGGFPTAVAGIVAPALAAVRREHPEWEFEVCDTESEESLARLLDGSMDVAVVMAAPNRPLLGDPRLRVQPLLEEEYFAALPSDHPLARADAVALTELADESWILAREGFSCHDHLSGICADAGFQPRGKHRATDFTAALALIVAGFGVTLLPRLGVPLRMPDGVSLVPLRSTPRRYSLMATRQGAAYPELEAALRAAGVASTGPVEFGS
jgi:DNA-binding transcriptional LysR family regulator